MTGGLKYPSRSVADRPIEIDGQQRAAAQTRFGLAA
jgi:hypothetical protein